MIPATTLRTLRAIGYELRAEHGDVIMVGPRPWSEAAALAWLAEHKIELLALLEDEQREQRASTDRVLALDFTKRRTAP